MAFTVSNVQTAVLAAGIKFYVGDYTGTAGDASGTITLNGGRVYLAAFEDQSTTSPSEDPDVSVSTSGSTITVTVHNHSTVTAGRFVIIYA